jgi:hypothetical protein
MYDRIADALANLGHQVSDQTIGNILKRHGIAPAPKRSQSTSWKDFIGVHMAVLAGTDFLTVEVLTWSGFVTYYVLFFLHLDTRRITLTGITRHPTETWMTQMARNTVDEPAGAVRQSRYLLHTATPNSARPSRMCSPQRESAASSFRHEVQI